MDIEGKAVIEYSITFIIIIIIIIIIILETPTFN
jgi:uncharacterized Tic20 family protein